MTDEEKQKDKSLEEWLTEEEARLDKGFSFEPQPSSETNPSSSTEDILASAGLGAGIVGGAMAGHVNPVTFEGCPASVIVEALKSEISSQDTRLEIKRSGDTVMVTFHQSQSNRPHDFSPALTITMLESEEVLTVTMSDLNQDAKRGAIASIGKTALSQSWRLFFRRRGIGGMLRTADTLMDGIEDVTEDLQDLSLPKRVWAVIDRVGGATEEAYLEERRRKRELERKREAAERAWTHCEWCGRAYAENEKEVVICPSCGASRGPKPKWLA